VIGGGGGLVDVELASGQGIGGAGDVLGLDRSVEAGGVDTRQGDLETVDMGQGIALASDGVDAGDGPGLVDDLGA
jgi:hypothetical protein